MAIGFITYGTYRTERVEGKEITKVYLFGRLKSGESFLAIKKADPYFYIKQADITKAQKLKTSITFETKDTSMKNFEGDPVAKVILAAPKYVKPLRELFGKENITYYEADIRFVTRVLMDRGIKGIVEVQGDHRKADEKKEFVDCVYEEPELKAPKEGTTPPELNVLSFDIETTPDGTKLHCLSVYSKYQGKETTKAWIIKKKAKNAVTLENEAELCDVFARAIRELDPDVVTGWNVIDFDLALLRTKFKKYQIPMKMGRNDWECTLRVQESYFADSKADFPGRQVLDGIHLLKGAFIKLPDYKLNTAAKEFVGKGKLISGPDRYEELEQLYEKNPDKLIAYNILDSKLAYQILENSDVLNLAVQRSMLAGMFLDRVNASVASLDFVYISRAMKKGLVVSTSDYGERDERIKGGFVMASKPGIYKNILVLDFKSLYPSIIRTFHIDPYNFVRKKDMDKYKEDELVTSPNKAHFKNQEGILGEILQELWKQRDEAKKQKNTLASHAIKILMNSMFGVLANPSCRFYNLDIANSITHFGQYLNKLTTKKIEEKGYEVIYGDTDSVFVNPKTDDPNKAEEIGQELQKYINAFYNKHVQEEYHTTNFLELEFEKNYLKFLMPHVRGSTIGAKKRYAGMIKKDGKNEIQFVGLEFVRRDWTDAAKKFQKELYEQVFHEKDPTAYVKDFAKKLKVGKLDELLVYRKALRKNADEYVKTTPPHVKAARKLGMKGFGIIEYVVTTNGPEPIQKLKSKIDYDHYIEKQIKPIADSILGFYDTSFDDLMKGDQKKLFDF
jgi:DNA polymerase II